MIYIWTMKRMEAIIFLVIIVVKALNEEEEEDVVVVVVVVVEDVEIEGNFSIFQFILVL